MGEDLLDRALALLKECDDVDPAALTHLYLFGSRVFGVHKPHSDFDLIALVQGCYFVGEAPPKDSIPISMLITVFFFLSSGKAPR